MLLAYFTFMGLTFVAKHLYVFHFEMCAYLLFMHVPDFSPHFKIMQAPKNLNQGVGLSLHKFLSICTKVLQTL